MFLTYLKSLTLFVFTLPYMAPQSR